MRLWLSAAGGLMMGTCLMAAAATGADSGEDAAFQHLSDLARQHQSVTTEGALAQADEAAFSAASAFLADYPESPRVSSVAELWTQVADEMAMLKLSDAPRPEEIAKKLAALADDPKLASKKAAIRFVEAGWLLDRLAHGLESSPGAWAAADEKIAAFGQEFGGPLSFDGQTSAVGQLREEEFEALQSSTSPGATALLEKLVADKNAKVAQVAQQILANRKTRASFLGQPLELKFKAVDGSAVDLARLRGKAVLIDFWATWCPPCREEMPAVLAAYRKYHGQGFEIVGISLDQDAATLTAFTKQAGMTWPQACDGQSFDGALPKRFGIDSIPAMWLVDKKGILVSENAGEDLEGQVARCLASP